MHDNIHLVVFLSRAMPLRRWDKMGILDREVAIYKRMLPKLGMVTIVTSGGDDELLFQDRLGDIKILHNHWGLSPNLYSLLAPILHAKTLRHADVYKNNQPDGSWTAIIASKLFHKPLIARAGYLWAELHRTNGGRGIKAMVIDWLQRVLFKNASQIILTTATMKQHIVEKYSVLPQKITVVPNYVDSSQFHPRPEIKPECGRICFVGRLHPVKNLDLLIQAIAQFSQASLFIIGDGPQREELESLVKKLNAPVRFMGIIPQGQIAIELNRSNLFILPSDSEGHPKALIEAMTAGTAVIGTNVIGIKEIIEHNQTGWLCSPDSASIHDAIQHLLSNPDLQKQLAKAARTYAIQNYSLTHIAAQEEQIIIHLVDQTR